MPSLYSIYPLSHISLSSPTHSRSHPALRCLFGRAREPTAAKNVRLLLATSSPPVSTHDTRREGSLSPRRRRGCLMELRCVTLHFSQDFLFRNLKNQSPNKCMTQFPQLGLRQHSTLLPSGDFVACSSARIDDGWRREKEGNCQTFFPPSSRVPPIIAIVVFSSSSSSLSIANQACIMLSFGWMSAVGG